MEVPIISAKMAMMLILVVIFFHICFFGSHVYVFLDHMLELEYGKYINPQNFLTRIEVISEVHVKKKIAPNFIEKFTKLSMSLEIEVESEGGETL